MAGRRAAALVLLAGLAGVAHAGVIAVGSLQSCVNDGTVSGAAPKLAWRLPCFTCTFPAIAERHHEAGVPEEDRGVDNHRGQQPLPNRGAQFQRLVRQQVHARLGDHRRRSIRSLVYVHTPLPPPPPPSPLPPALTRPLPAACCSTTGSCPCGCDYTKDPGCSCRNLQQGIRVSLQKTPVYASYPLTAHRTPFNGAPYEVSAGRWGC